MLLTKDKPRLINLNYSLSYLLSILLIIGNTVTSCRKFVTIEPPITQLVTANVFSNDATATSVVVGIYSQMMQSSGFLSGNALSISALTGLSSNELTNYAPAAFQKEFYINQLTAANSYVNSYFWAEPYKYIYDANAVIEALTISASVSDPVKKQLIGEAEFIRSLCYFYLVNTFGDVPLILTTNYQINENVSRSPSQAVYQQVIEDLKAAQSNMADDYSYSNGERVRPNKAVATALLARVYLYTKDWPNAEIQSSILINNPAYQIENNLNKVFLANSTETIWQLMPVKPGYNTNEGSLFILNTTPTSSTLSRSLINAFEEGDLRRTNWVDSLIFGTNIYYYPYKYKIKSGSVLTEYSTVFRLSEQYLIRAEARAEQNNINGAQDDLNIIRARAGLANTDASDQSSLLKVVLHERQVELFTEGGHRWLDLKRSSTLDSAMTVITALKGTEWHTNQQLYPIPESEIQKDPNLIQNTGY
jgi:hypothetical protein